MALMVPIGLSQYSVQNKLDRELRLYLCLKFFSEGVGILHDTPDLIHRLCIKLKLSKRSIKRHLNSLHDLNWIGSNNSRIYVRSYRTVMRMIRSKKKGCSEIFIEDVVNLKEWVLSTTIKCLCNQQKWLNKRKGESEVSKKRDAYQSLTPSFFPIAISTLSKILNLSDSSIVRLKKRAQQKGYIKVKKNVVLIHQLGFLFTGLSKNLEKEKIGAYRVFRNKLYRQKSDEFISVSYIRKRSFN